MRPVFYIFAMITIASCSTGSGDYGSPQANQAHHEPQTENFWEKRIKKAMTGFDSQRVPVDSFPVTKEILETGYVEEFKANICKKISHSRCVKKLRDVIHAKLLLQYPRSSKEYFDLQCRANPGKCDGLEFMEAAYINSHNSWVEEQRQKWKEQELKEIDNMQITGQ